MSILNRINFFAIAILMLSMGLKMQAQEDDSPEYTNHVAEATSFLKEVYKKDGFECEASGDSMPSDVEEIDVQLLDYIEKLRKTVGFYDGKTH